MHSMHLFFKVQCRYFCLQKNSLQTFQLIFWCRKLRPTFLFWKGHQWILHWLSNLDLWSVLAVAYNYIRVHLLLGSFVDFLLVFIHHLWEYTFVNDLSVFMSICQPTTGRIVAAHIGAFAKFENFEKLHFHFPEQLKTHQYSQFYPQSAILDTSIPCNLKIDVL